MRVGVALGSNLGDPLKQLRDARDQIEALPKVQAPILVSPLYETEPVGCEENASKFLNATIEFEYSGEPQELLGKLAEIEESLGRPRSHLRNASRLIDLDLLYFGDLESKTAKLELPHPRMTQREFVLRPLADIRPDLVLPGQTDPVRRLLLRTATKSGAVLRAATQW